MKMKIKMYEQEPRRVRDRAHDTLWRMLSALPRPGGDHCGWQRIVRGSVALVLLAAVLILFGCSDGGSDDIAPAAATDLANQNFEFADGAAFGLAGQTVTLTVGDFANDGDGNANTGPFTLTSASGTATGTLTIGSCTLLILTTTFDALTDPGFQVGQTVLLDPCNVNRGSRALEVRNADTNAVSESDRPTPNAVGVAFVLTTDFSTGSYSVVDLATRNTFNDIDLGGVHSDAIARFSNGLVYVVNSFGADNIQTIDPQEGYMTVAQESVGNGTNPQDIAVVSATKAYVSRLGSDELLIMNPVTLVTMGTIDLSALTKADDTDGVPELFRMLVHEGLVYLLLQHTDNNTGFPPVKVSAGELVVLDPDMDEVVHVIELNGTNPFTDLQFSPELNRILVSVVGDFAGSSGGNDGGIVAVDPVTQTVDPGFLIDEATIGGNITHFVVVSASKGFAVVLNGTESSLVSFDPSSGQVLNTLVPPSMVFLSYFAINRAGELYLAATDLTTPTPGVRIFDTEQETELAFVNVGQLPPNFIVFIE